MKIPAKPKRCGVSLLVCLFVMSITSVLIVGMLDTTMIQMTASRNSVDYERALYLAGAAVHHALAELETTPSWRGSISNTTFPVGSKSTYSAVAVDGTGNKVTVIGTGISNGVTRNLQVTVKP